jgi:hypothetical protein
MRKTPLLAILGALACVSCAPPPATPSTLPTNAASEPAPPAAPAANAITPSVAKRVAICLGRKCGTSALVQAVDGGFTSTLDVLENGRGPHVDASFRLNAAGTITKLSATGHHTMGTQFTSTFVDANGITSWKATEETGQKNITEPSFYLPLAEIPELDGMLVQAALKRGGDIALLPAGRAHVEKALEVEVSAGGQKRTVIGYEVSGVDLIPNYTWMNPDGSWFGMVNEWFSVVPEGWESVIDPLVLKQRELRRARDAKLYGELAHKPPAQGLAYTHARVLDVAAGKWLPDHTVVVVDGKIESVGPAKTTKVPEGAEVVDLANRALIPGLWDMHAHFGDADGPLDIASGVTTARDVGNDPDRLDDYKLRIDNGQAVGPHILRFGFIEGRNEKAASSKVTAETADEAKAAVKFFVDRKYDGVKIYNSVKPELVPLIAKEAHANGLRVTGHIPVHMLASEAVNAGYDGIEHINMLFLNFFATHETDTRDTTRFTLVGEKAADFDLSSKPVKEFVKLLKDKHTVIDPTVNAFEDLLLGEQGRVIPGLESVVTRLPITLQRQFLLGGLPMADHKDRYNASFQKLLAMIKLLHDSKVQEVVGTDALAGLMLHHEMMLFERAGISRGDVIKMATLDAAHSMGMDAHSGSITKGKVADLVVIDGDPLAQLSDIDKVVSTMSGGLTFDSPAVYRAVSVAPLTAK